MKTRLGRLNDKLLSPLSWRTRTRRLFLLTFPISVPVWCALSILVLLGRGFHILVQPIVYFWTAPPKKRRRAYYGYRGKGIEKPARVVRIHDREAA